MAAGKTTGAFSRLLGRGGGTSLPGYIASGMAPNLVRDLAGQLTLGCVIVTGTNGKTTTARMISQILEEAGFAVVRNRAGANMMRGISTSLLERSDWTGHIRLGESSIGVFEVDEAALPGVLSQVQCRVVVLLNVFRDQLDRYGEVASIPAVWKEPLARTGDQCTVVANADDPLIAEVTPLDHQVVWFGLDVADQGLPDYGGDVKSCPRCSGPIGYSRHYYGHLGDYCCDQCGFRRPTPDLRVAGVDLEGIDSTAINVSAGERHAKIVLPLPGLYNASNAAAALAVTTCLGVDLTLAEQSLKDYTSAFGRLESFEVEGRTVHLLLAKNPTGYNQSLRTVFDGNDAKRHAVFLLNDNAADGRDVSWIWDVDFEMASGRLSSAICGGERSQDMALRLKYAEVVEPQALETTYLGSREVLEAALKQTVTGDGIYVFATYTAMLDFRMTMTKLGHAPPYWSR